MDSEAWTAVRGAFPWWLDPWVAAAFAALGAGLALGQGFRALSELARRAEVPARRGVIASVSMAIAAASAAILLAGPGSVRLAERGLPVWSAALAALGVLSSAFPRAAGFPLFTLSSLAAVLSALLLLPLHPASGTTSLASALPVSVREDGVRLSFETLGPDAGPVVGALDLEPGAQRLAVDLIRLEGPLAAFFGPARWRLRAIEGSGGAELHRFPARYSAYDLVEAVLDPDRTPVRLPFMTVSRVRSSYSEPQELVRRAFRLTPEGMVDDGVPLP
ncbi:MAG: hypothetical protein JXA15_03285 [Spirochaetales bacterium]|nr:hypothetical protein [Spirochaetales bacterium]